MQKNPLVLGLTAIFGGMTGLVVLIALTLYEPVLFVVAVPLAVATYAFWYQSSGRLQDRFRRARNEAGGVGGEDRGGFGAGPRSGFEGARGQRARERRERARQAGERTRGAGGSGPRPTPGVTPAEAYRRLGLESGADEAEVKRAYREKVKEVHPDRGGDEEAFKRVTEAYERLID